MADFFKNIKLSALFGNSNGASEQLPEGEDGGDVEGANGNPPPRIVNGGEKKRLPRTSDELSRRISGMAGRTPIPVTDGTEITVQDETKALFGWDGQHDDSDEAKVCDKTEKQVDATHNEANNFVKTYILGSTASVANAFRRAPNKNVVSLENGNTQKVYTGQDEKGNTYEYCQITDKDDKQTATTLKYVNGNGMFTKIAKTYNDEGNVVQSYTEVQGSYCSLDGYTYDEKGNQIGRATEVYTPVAAGEESNDENVVSGNTVVVNMLGSAGASLRNGLNFFSNDTQLKLFAKKEEQRTLNEDGRPSLSTSTVSDANGFTRQRKTIATEYNGDNGERTSTTQNVENYNENGQPYQSRTVVTQYRPSDQKVASQEITVTIPVDNGGHTENVTSSATIVYNYRDNGTLANQETSGTDMSGRRIEQTLAFNDAGTTVVSARISYDGGAVVQNYEGDNVLNRVRGSLPDTTEVYENGNLQYKVESHFDSDGVLVRVDVKDGNNEQVAYYDLTSEGEGLVIVSPRENSPVVTFINAMKDIDGGEDYVRSLVKKSINEAGQIIYSVDFPGAQVILDSVKQKLIDEFGAEHPEMVEVIDKLLTPAVIQNVIRLYGLENIVREFTAGNISSITSGAVTIPANLKDEILAQAQMVSGTVPVQAGAEVGNIVAAAQGGISETANDIQTPDAQIAFSPEAVVRPENPEQLVQNNGVIDMSGVSEGANPEQNTEQIVEQVNGQDSQSAAVKLPGNSEVAGGAGNTESAVVQNSGIVNLEDNIPVENETPKPSLSDILGVDDIRQFITSNVPDYARFEITADEFVQMLHKAGIEYTAGSPEIAVLERAFEGYLSQIRRDVGVMEYPETVAGIDLSPVERVAEAPIADILDISFAMTGIMPQNIRLNTERNARRVFIEDGRVRLVSEMEPESVAEPPVETQPGLRVPNPNSGNRFVRTVNNAPAGSTSRAVRVPGKYVTSTGEVLDYDELVARIMESEGRGEAVVVTMNVVQHPVGARTVSEGPRSFNIVGVTDDGQVILADNINPKSFVPGESNYLTIDIKEMEGASTLITIVPVNRILNTETDPTNSTTIYNGGARVASASGGTGSGDGGGGGGNGQQDAAPATNDQHHIAAESGDRPAPPTIVFPSSYPAP